MNAQPIAVVPHEKVRVRAWLKPAGGAYPVLADPGFAASAAYGVAFQMRVHTDTSNTPGTFIIDRAGVLRRAYVGEGEQSWRDRPSVEEVQQELAALGN